MAKYPVIFCLLLCTSFAYGETLSLNDALRATYSACVGIDDSLLELKKMAGINTVITGVGTGFGAGATIVGIVKSKKDADAKKIADSINYTQKPYQVMPTKEEIEEAKAQAKNDFTENDFKKLRDESKKLGDWRTGLMVGNTATNVAGAIIANKNRVDDNLQGQIDDCKSAVRNLQSSIVLAKTEGTDITEAQTIYNACREYDYVDISKINKQAKGATVSSVVGAATGLTGTITSAVANSESVRKDNVGIKNKTNADWNKEKNINTAANVLAGASTVASATATVFNATQIKAIKDVANVAAKCTGVLK